MRYLPLYILFLGRYRGYKILISPRLPYYFWWSKQPVAYHLCSILTVPTAYNNVISSKWIDFFTYFMLDLINRIFCFQLYLKYGEVELLQLQLGTQATVAKVYVSENSVQTSTTQVSILWNNESWLKLSRLYFHGEGRGDWYRRKCRFVLHWILFLENA